MQRKLVFLTRTGCGLCADALPKVERAARWLRCPVEVVDITTDPDLESDYHIRIPVVLDQRGDVLAEGAISARDAFKAALATYR